MPIRAALSIHHLVKEKPLKVIRDDVENNERSAIRRCRKISPLVLFPVQKCNTFGVEFKLITEFTCRYESAAILWILTRLLTRVEISW